MAPDKSKSESESDSDSTQEINSQPASDGCVHAKPNNENKLDGADLNADEKESRVKDREDRPLVLEERHSLSIAETKKRRASVYSHENLFIPKELARGELHQRRHHSAVNTLDQISRNTDYRIRMLKFPVGSGRARYVAQQMRRKKTRKSMEIADELDVVDITKEEFRIKRESNADECDKLEYILPLSMPNLDAEHMARNHLHSDDECCIILEDIVSEALSESEEDGTEELIERVSKRQLKTAAGQELIPRKDELMAEKQELQHLPVFRWHNPECSDQDIKMGLMDDLEHITSSANADIQVGFSEVKATADIASPQLELREQEQELSGEQEQAVEEVLEVAVTELEEVPRNEPTTTQQQQQPERSIEEQQPVESINVMTSEQESQDFQCTHSHAVEIQPQQQHVADVPYMPLDTAATSSYQTFEAHSTSLPLGQPFMQRISLPHVYSGELLQSNSASNNESMQQHFVESVVSPELLQQWSKQYFEKYVYSRPAPQEQQLPYVLQHQQQQHHQHQSYQDQQLEADKKELQQLNAQHQHLKCQEAEQLKHLNKTLKEVYANRLLSERQHAEYHRIFMHKMVESKKHEESLLAQKKHLKSQLQAELNVLEQRIAKSHRQLHERSRTWQWQQQHHQQQHQQQQLQLQQQQPHQHFLHQLPPPVYHPRLQCFQDAFSQCIEARIPPPTTETETQRRLMPAPPPATYCADNILQPPVASSSSERTSNSGNIMRRRHTIDYRASNIAPYAYPTHRSYQQPQQPRSRATNFAPSSMSAVHRFTLPETPISSGRTQVNAAIEQSAITSIIGNYVSNYLNDMETPNP